MIPRFILSALSGKPPVIYGDGLQTRDFTYVTETAEILARLAALKDSRGQVYNVCYGQEVSIREIATLILELTGSKLEPVRMPGRPSDVLRLFGDARKLQSTLGMKPQVSIREGLTRTVEWFRENVQLTPAVLASMDPQNWSRLEPEPWIPS